MTRVSGTDCVPLVATGVTDKEGGLKCDGVVRQGKTNTRLPNDRCSGTQALLEPNQWGDQTKRVPNLQHRREVQDQQAVVNHEAGVHEDNTVDPECG